MTNIIDENLERIEFEKYWNSKPSYAEVEKDSEFRGWLASKRNTKKTILHITLGDKDWEPTVKDLETIRNAFQDLREDDINHVGLIVTRNSFNVKLNEIQETEELKLISGSVVVEPYVDKDFHLATETLVNYLKYLYSRYEGKSINEYFNTQHQFSVSVYYFKPLAKKHKVLIDSLLTALNIELYLQTGKPTLKSVRGRTSLGYIVDTEHYKLNEELVEALNASTHTAKELGIILFK